MSPPLDSTRFEQIRASGDLPSPKGIALAVIRLTRQQDVSTAELARVIGADPAFVGRLIKAANGLVAFSRRPVASVHEALMVLGLPAVRTMVLGFSLLSHYRRGACQAFDYNRFWSISLARALAAQVFAERTRAAPADELFAVGLLGSVGELALATLYPADYAAVLEGASKTGAAPLLELERVQFAMDHRELTGAMLEDWGLPRIFIDAVAHARDPEESHLAEGSRARRVLQVLVAARCVAEICVSDDNTARSALAVTLFAEGARLGMERECIVADCERIAALWAEWGRMLQLEQPGAPCFGDLVEAGPVTAATGRAPAASPARARSPGRLPATPAITEATGTTSGEPVAPVQRALIVDDEARTRAGLRAVLEQAHYEVHEAGDGREGMELALELQPQIMILDWNLPELDGPDLVRSLRQTRIGQAIYMILLTHSDDDEHLVAAFEAGADDFIAKPLRPRVLGARLRAGQRVVRLQQEVEREHEEIRHFASQLAVTNRRLHEAALTDALTGFPNRRYAIDRVQQEWSAAQRWGRPVSCMIIDLDNFKQINDTFGHDVGDEVLRSAADALRGALRGQDVVCRTGGDEFLAICPETDLDHALSCAERLRTALDSLSLQAGDARVAISASIGVAMREHWMPDVDALIKQADLGAYLAKQKGRNRVATVQKTDESSGVDTVA
ncbi:diguanylate cyclase [Aromatoleum toluclasticum]|uniref:GGDEF domain-containing response regulator n=1 Tax=Aromatoleum toluclasticum TaxID=92003 RepID=UPI001D187C8F|nr:diguanylate cyclase [Aromatoleum toluclasticum]MCC4116886.1 diguanylate cyclase [Aromatoleum toluclasticum]